MHGLTMNAPLTVPVIGRRARTLFGDKRITTRLPDRNIHRYRFDEMMTRAMRLAVALRSRGVGRGDRVATLGWNHSQHLEVYYAVPAIGAVLHTLNLRLHPDDLTYIVNDAQDSVLFVDESVLPLWQQLKDRVNIQHVIV